MALQTRGVNPDDYITIPARIQDKYKSKTYGANMTMPRAPAATAPTITVLPADDATTIQSADFQPVNLETVNRAYIDSVEITE